MATEDDGTTSLPVTEIYTSWINSCLTNNKVADLQEDLKDGNVLCQLLETTTSTRLLSTDEEKDENATNLFKAINFVKEKGVEVANDCEEEISQGDLKAILDLLWQIILNFDVHSHSRAAYQRSVSMGKRFLIEWISKELPDVIVDPKGNFVASFQNGFLLSRIISKYCETDSNDDSEELQNALNNDNIESILNTASNQLGVPSSIISPELLFSGQIDEYTLLIYLAVLRRKISEKKGEEVFKGGGSPIKHPTPQSTPVKTRPKTPPTGLNGQSPLSPATLKKLVDQQAKSHEAIQALQAKLQAINYHPFSPKLLKSAPRPESREMPPVFGISCDSTPRRHSLPEIIDYNMKEEDTGKRSDIDALNGNNFFESMLDAMKDYMIPKEPTTNHKINSENEKNTRTKQQLNTEDVDKGAEVSLEKLGVDLKTDKESTIDDSEQVNGDKPHDEYVAINQGMTNGDLELEVINSEANEAKTVVSANSINTSSREETNEEQDSITETPESPQKLAKRVQFSGLDTVFADTKDSESPNTTITETISPNTSSSPKELSFSDNDDQKPSMEDSNVLAEKAPCSETVTWASLGSSFELNGNDYEPGNSSVIFDEENDQFMMYLNSIEQTALKFKLQVEQAKIDTLQILKKRLEQAYEGTPLEEIPAKVHDKLQETIAQIATEEVKKYESVLSSDMEEEFDDEECGILQQMRVELDSLAAENYRLTQELENTKKYETEYHELQKKIEGMEDGLTSMKHDYATKNGESEFLGKRIEALEQEMISMRVEYEEQIRELQNQNIDLQKECLELDNENRALEDEIRRIQVGLSDHSTDEEISRVQNDDYLAERITAAELEAVEHRVNELERHNKALKAAGEADHAVVVCLEKKVEELEGSLNEAKSANSDLLTELHDSQRQQASDRAKLTSYREELEALKRENRVLKCSLETAENEVQYQKRRNERKKTDSLTRSPGSLGNKREIWNEIRELETILKDVQKEKVTIERKYKAFRQDSNEKTSSLNNTPRNSTLNLSSPSCASPVSATRSSPDSTLTRPKKTSSLLERVNSLLEKSSLPNGTTLPHPTRDHKIKTTEENTEKSVGTSRNNEEKAKSVPDELTSLRNHVGSLEAEKASILRELSHLRTPKKDEKPE